jgi:hypothetical protein
VAAHHAQSSKPSQRRCLTPSTALMSKRKRPLPDPQELLTLMDNYLTALYHQRHDPERPPELADRICRHIRPADLGKLV